MPKLSDGHRFLLCSFRCFISFLQTIGTDLNARKRNKSWNCRRLKRAPLLIQCCPVNTGLDRALLQRGIIRAPGTASYQRTRMASWAAASLLLRNSSNFCASLDIRFSAIRKASNFSAALSCSFNISASSTVSAHSISLRSGEDTPAGSPYWSLRCYGSMLQHQSEVTFKRLVPVAYLAATNLLCECLLPSAAERLLSFSPRDISCRHASEPS